MGIAHVTGAFCAVIATAATAAASAAAAPAAAASSAIAAPPGGESILKDLTVILGGGLIGGIVTWFYSKRQSLTQHRVQQELWDRKFRLAEADREAAVAALNQNNIDVKRIKATFENQVQRIALLETDLKTERSSSGELRIKLDKQGEVIGKLQGERGQIATAVASTKAESERKTKVFKELSDERDRYASEVQTLKSECESLETRHAAELQALATTLSDREAALESWERRHGE
ncbi:MAG: hypothetical protein AAFZ87_16060, partial [Planctomycetota bacterium]